MEEFEPFALSDDVISEPILSLLNEREEQRDDHLVVDLEVEHDGEGGMETYDHAPFISINHQSGGSSSRKRKNTAEGLSSSTDWRKSVRVRINND